MLQELRLVPNGQTLELREESRVEGEHGGEGVEVAAQEGVGEALVAPVEVVQAAGELGDGLAGRLQRKIKGISLIFRPVPVVYGIILMYPFSSAKKNLLPDTPCATGACPP